MIYAILAVQADESPVAIKIGFSGNPLARLAELRTASPHKLYFVTCQEGGRLDEAMIHAALAEHRQHGEWFNYCEPVIDVVHKMGRLDHELMNGIVAIAEAEAQFPPEGRERLQALYNWARDRILRYRPKMSVQEPCWEKAG